MKSDIVIWLVRDTCRVVDNPALNLAAQIANERDALVVPLACLEPRRWADQQFGMSRTGSHWVRFRSESLQGLRRDLVALGSGLWVSAEEPVYALNRMNSSVNVIKVVCDRPLATEERLENARIEAEGYRIFTHDVDDLFRFEQLPFELDELPASFSKFRKIVEKKLGLVPDPPVEMHELPPCMEQPWPDPVEWIETFDSRLPTQAEVETYGGETQAQRHWTTYLDAKALSHYKQTRNAFCGPMQSSHLSAWLAHGCLSARQIWSDTLAYEAREGANESTYWLRFELLWREYFRWYARVSDWTLFRRNGPSDKDVAGDHNKTRFDGWKTGHTNCDIVDAAMRELNETGWMSNRARQLVASHLIYELNLDWRLGAAYFESQLIDFDVASNWGNWAYIAGVGPDPRGGRIFNLNDQADRYDPDQSYRRRWLT
ncbi:DASH family cryptochrome [Litorivicinus sp.]|nr:DASH family cryptochrome [Litorivicinus sp.]